MPPKSSPPLVCVVCGAEFKVESLRTMHMQTRHSESASGSPSSSASLPVLSQSTSNRVDVHDDPDVSHLIYTRPPPPGSAGAAKHVRLCATSLFSLRFVSSLVRLVWVYTYWRCCLFVEGACEAGTTGRPNPYSTASHSLGCGRIPRYLRTTDSSSTRQGSGRQTGVRQHFWRLAQACTKGGRHAVPGGC